MWSNVIIKGTSFEVHVQSASENSSFVVCDTALLQHHLTNRPIRELQPHARGQSLVRGVLYSPLLCPQVHCSLHLAANQAYLRKLWHDMREESRSSDLYGRLQRDREGTLCSPYRANASDISWQCRWHQEDRHNCSVRRCWLPVVYWHRVASVELIPFDAFCQIHLLILEL